MILPLLLLLILALTVAAVVVVARSRAPGGMHHVPPDHPIGGAGQAVRRFFQYLLLCGLLFAAASGLTGLLGRVLDTGTDLLADQSLLALQITFTVIALPLWAALAWWTVRRQRAEPAETRTLGWTAYLTVVGLVTLVVAVTGWHRTLRPLLGPDAFEAGGLAQALVWTAVWVGHHLWGLRTTSPTQLRPLHLLSTLLGLALAATGLIWLVGAALRELVGLTGPSLVGSSLSPFVDGAILLLVGGVVWAAHWFRGLVGGPREPGWLALVLLAGVGGGLLMAVVAASLLGYAVLVWLLGDPGSPSAQEHFSGAPAQAAVVLVGLLLWWYHQAALGARRALARTEVRRIYEYLMAAVGLVAASAGLVMVLVTIVEAVAAGPDLVVGGRAVNALLAASMLLAVGVPVWWWHWRQAQRARIADPPAEVASPTRRLYLLILFGVMGVAAVIALITLVFLVVEDALGTGLAMETLRRVRFAIGVLVTTALLSGYHWTSFRADRDVQPAGAPGGQSAPGGQGAPGGPGGQGGSGPRADEGPGPRLRHVLLVGASDDGVARALHERTGAGVQVVVRRDAQVAPWSLPDLVDALGDHEGDVLVLAEEAGLRVLPVVQGAPAAYPRGPRGEGSGG